MGVLLFTLFSVEDGKKYINNMKYSHENLVTNHQNTWMIQ